MARFAELSLAEDFRRAAEKQRKMAENQTQEVAARMLLIAKSYDQVAEMLEHPIGPPQ